MFSKIHFELEKKNRYLIQSFLVGVFIYVFTQGVINVSFPTLGMFSLILVSTGVLVTHYPGVTRGNFLYSILMPLGVLAGAILSLHFYPNLGNVFKILVILFFSGLYYLVSLSDNVFLVVYDREEIIPLYRVAVTWSQILQAVVAMQKGKVIDLNTSLALAAAKLSLEHQLPMADSIILATAQEFKATIWTQDVDFKGIGKVKYFPKQ